MRPRPRAVLVHGVASTVSVFESVAGRLAAAGWQVVAEDRPRSGDLAVELDWLAGLLTSPSWVLGLSGGATLGLAAAGAGLPMAGAVLHEPAAGGLVPDLLDGVRDAFGRSGTPGLGKLLYGPAWSPSPGLAADDVVTARDLAMFRGVEPTPPDPRSGRVLVTTGERSPDIRHRVARELAGLGYATAVVPDAAHLVTREAPAAWARVALAWVSGRV